MADPLSKFSALDYYNKAKSATLKDLMDLLSSRTVNQAKPADVILAGKNQQLNDRSAIPQAMLSDVQDAKVLVSSLKKLMDLSQFLSLNNQSSEIMISQEAIPKEIEGQHKATVLFKGPFFDLLREIVQNNSENNMIKGAVADILKNIIPQSINESPQNKIMDAAANLFQFLLQMNDEDLSSRVNSLISKDLLTIELEEIVHLAKDILAKYPEDEKVQHFLKEIVQSFSMIDNKKASLMKAIDDLIDLLDDPQKNQAALKDKLIDVLKINFKTDAKNENLPVHLLNDPQFIENLKQDTAAFEKLLGQLTQTAKENAKQDTVVLEKMLSLIENNIEKIDSNEAFRGVSEQILKNILVGQNFKSPMLHFALPIHYEGMNAFGELWLDANGENEGKESKNKSFRIFLVIDITDIGIFEVDILLEGKKLSTRLYCPPTLINAFSDAESSVREVASNAGLQLNKMEVVEFKKARTLNEVFQNPVESRYVLDVRV